eukprot:CAMPEP_0113600872 /NCGR_PEP_ID=MMETSP0015_2-20120614/42931_1 /TAXON_ID=2838 /ORGANISM="Odontella" /LENGTH=188 /DNA_ID=CAMNT_0000509143 /DNA_START=139 /DNA_END=702 /DNA_ORIENTATION=- /assembly_acc=CAM_ASM_000160
MSHAAPPSPPPIMTPQNLSSALGALSGGHHPSSPSSGPEMIKQAETALLHWESTDVDGYCGALLGAIVIDAPVGGGEDGSMRLAAILALKAAVQRRWKDRGRGSPAAVVEPGGEGERPSDDMGLVTSSFGGGVGLVPPSLIPPPELTARLEYDRSVQSNAAALLSRIGRMDLPIEFGGLIPALVERGT